MDLFKMAKAEWVRASVDKRHPFRTFVLGTRDEKMEMRTVVMRSFDSSSFTLRFYTDSRSPKYAQIHRNNQVALLFYHPSKKLQIRAHALATELSPESTTYRSIKANLLGSGNTSDYTTLYAPGALRDSPDKALSYGEDIYLSCFDLEIFSMDLLLLSREGHQRMLAEKDIEGWRVKAIIP